MRRMTRSTALAGLTILALARGSADAHGGIGPNGGRVQDAGPWHAELVTQGTSVAVYLSDEGGKPLDAAGFKGTAIFVIDGKPARIALEPDGNRLAGKAATALGERPKGAVRLEAPGGASGSARFD